MCLIAKSSFILDFVWYKKVLFEQGLGLALHRRFVVIVEFGNLAVF